MARHLILVAAIVFLSVVILSRLVCGAMAQLILKRGDPSRRREGDYDVLENGTVVGRIFKAPVAPADRSWMWAGGHGGHIERATHGYEPTREAAVAAFAKSCGAGSNAGATRRSLFTRTQGP
jgi:hypothetical protein